MQQMCVLACVYIKYAQNCGLCLPFSVCGYIGRCGAGHMINDGWQLFHRFVFTILAEVYCGVRLLPRLPSPRSPATDRTLRTVRTSCIAELKL